MHLLQRFFGRSSYQRRRGQQDRAMEQEPLFSMETRRHRDDVPYALPKDIEEGQRLNLQHYIFRYAMQGNFASPLDSSISQILDVGSGTGIWGHEVARQFPRAHVFGLDLEPPQSISLAANVVASPPNYHFVQGNVLQGLPFPNGIFDFTHQRMLVLAVPAQKWPSVIRELKRVTRPGGWVEFLEMGTTILNAGPATAQLFEMSKIFLGKRGIDASYSELLGSLLEQEGVRQVQQRYLDIPIGSWDRLGTLLEKDIISAFQAIKPGVCQHGHIDPNHYDSLVAALPQEWQRGHAKNRFYLVYGQVESAWQ